MDVTVAVATFGNRSWVDLARRRAMRSAEALNVPVVHAHRSTLHEARNAALDSVTTEWVCHLDADDELEDGFFVAMDAASADVRAPAVRYVRNRRTTPRAAMPKVAGHHHDCTGECLTEGNWLVVGSVGPTQLLRDVGGWRDWPVYEDWDLWLRCRLAGATFDAVPDAVYRAHVRLDSRNRAPSRQVKVDTHHAIYRACTGTA